MSDESVATEGIAPRRAVFFDGASNRKRNVELTLGDALDIREAGALLASWPYDSIRRADGATDFLRVMCQTAPPLARLEIRDGDVAADLLRRCKSIDSNAVGRRGVAKIVGWSFAALASIVVLVIYGVPLAADRLTPLIPQSVERRIGQATDQQVRLLFSDKICTSDAGQTAFLKLVNALRVPLGLDTSIEAAVLASPIPNAITLPGGKIYLFSGLLEKASDPDEVAGVLAHELGHVRNRDSMRNLIYTGGTSFLVGLLFGDITGSGAVIFATRSLLNASFSREAEFNADTATINVMHALGRSPKPLGELLVRISGNADDKTTSIFASHPLSNERLTRMSQESRPVTGAPLLTASEWAALKAICD